MFGIFLGTAITLLNLAAWYGLDSPINLFISGFSAAVTLGGVLTYIIDVRQAQ